MSELKLHVVADAIRDAMKGMRAEVLVEMAADEGPTDLTPFCILAEAAIKAMREPTEAMVRGGRDAAWQFQDGSSRDGGPRSFQIPESDLRKAFGAMIDAALAEKA